MQQDFGYPYGIVEVPANVEVTEVSDCCPGCEDAQTIQPGHVYCWFDADKAVESGGVRITGRTLTNSGWKSLVATS